MEAEQVPCEQRVKGFSRLLKQKNPSHWGQQHTQYDQNEPRQQVPASWDAPDQSDSALEL